MEGKYGDVVRTDQRVNVAIYAMLSNPFIYSLCLSLGSRGKIAGGTSS